jgi:uncharacterized protein YuzE
MQTDLNSHELNWIIDIAREQIGDDENLINALEKCTKGRWESNAYLQFVSSKKANEPDAEWQIQESIVLQHEIEGELVIDVLKDGRIGGIEFISRIEQ